MPHPVATKDMTQCIEVCQECHDVCLETVTHCLMKGGQHAEAGHIRLLLDCAQICATSADFMQRRSMLHGEICSVCAEVCERCAESCEQFGQDEQMAACAEVCRRCAASCRTMGGSRKRAAA